MVLLIVIGAICILNGVAVIYFLGLSKSVYGWSIVFVIGALLAVAAFLSIEYVALDKVDFKLFVGNFCI